MDKDDSAVDPRDPTVMYVTVPDELAERHVHRRLAKPLHGRRSHHPRHLLLFGRRATVGSAVLSSECACLCSRPPEPFARWAVLLGGLTVLGVLMLWLADLETSIGVHE